MSTLISSVTQPPLGTILANPTIITPPASTYMTNLLSDKATIVTRNVNTMGVSTDKGVTTPAVHSFDDSTWAFDGVAETPGGQLLASVRKLDNSAPGKVYRSNNWDPVALTATSWTLVKTCVGNGSYARISWGLNEHTIAPSWSRLAGAIFFIEYGLPKPTAYHAYMSTDDGVTWTQIFDLTAIAGADTDTHCHSICVDPWQRCRVYIAHGDTTHGIYYSDNVDKPTPTWTLVPGSNDPSTAGTKQVTTMCATEVGIVCLSDGAPLGVRLIPRRAGATGIGPIRERAAFGGGGSTYIGGTIWRNGGLQTPQPGSPMFLCSQESQSQYSRPVIFHSTDGGRTITEAYRHATGIATAGQTGIERVYGPMADGTVIATINVDGTWRHLILDYIPDSPSKLPTLPWARIFTGKQQFSATVASVNVMNETGSGAVGGTSGGQFGFPFDPADYEVGGRTAAHAKLRLDLSTNGTAPGVTITASLYPVTGSAGNGGYTVGAIVTGSTATIPTPASGSNLSNEVEFDVSSLAAGLYVVQLTIPTGGMAAGSVMNARITVKARGL